MGKDDKTLQTKHARITGQAMRDHWGPIIDRIADETADWRDARIEALEAALREVFEEWAGSEGFIPETAPEAYLLQLTKRMADIARAALGEG